MPWVITMIKNQAKYQWICINDIFIGISTIMHLMVVEKSMNKTLFMCIMQTKDERVVGHAQFIHIKQYVSHTIATTIDHCHILFTANYCHNTWKLSLTSIQFHKIIFHIVNLCPK